METGDQEASEFLLSATKDLHPSDRLNTKTFSNPTNHAQGNFLK